MSGFKAYVRHSLEAIRADADLPYEEFVARRFSPAALEREAGATAPAQAREAVARYLPEDPDDRSFARMLTTYARCQEGCLDRAEGGPECWDNCRRAKAAVRRKG
jgi:hypothetical protein